MKKLALLLTLLVPVFTFSQIAVNSQSNFDECTIGVAHGSATQDGRPLAWKTRDFTSDYYMRISYATYCNYKFIYICPSSSPNYSTTGLNEHGLVIFKSNTYDLTPALTGPNDFAIIKHALGYCKSIDEFQEYLDSTNITGRSTTGNFAMIDSTGAASIFEVSGYEYWRFDAEDAPDGYIIRTNFTVNGGGSTGIQRHDQFPHVIACILFSGDSLSHRNLLRYHMKDFSDHASQPYPLAHSSIN